MRVLGRVVFSAFGLLGDLGAVVWYGGWLLVGIAIALIFIVGIAWLVLQAIF